MHVSRTRRPSRELTFSDLYRSARPPWVPRSHPPPAASSVPPAPGAVGGDDRVGEGAGDTLLGRDGATARDFVPLSCGTSFLAALIEDEVTELDCGSCDSCCGGNGPGSGVAFAKLAGTEAVKGADPSLDDMRPASAKDLSQKRHRQGEGEARWIRSTEAERES